MNTLRDAVTSSILNYFFSTVDTQLGEERCVKHEYQAGGAKKLYTNKNELRGPLVKFIELY